MKIIILTILIGILYISTVIGHPNYRLNSLETVTQSHSSLNSIHIAQGNSYSPNNENMNSEIVWQSISENTTYFPPINPDTYAINTGLAVGSTSGQLNVSGSASYSIPIKVPHGINSMQPSINLNYTSNYTDGVLGIGWQLGGLSSISRVNKTIYNDGQADAIRCNLTDRYALDGNRLIVTAGTYGYASSEYRTELDEFTKIVAYGSTGAAPGLGPLYFVAYSKSGLIYEYGVTEDSKLKNGDCILTWKLNKVYDRYNNQITFSYLTTDDELPIAMIEYTSNSSDSQSPFARILFNYKSKVHTNSYIYGQKLFTSNILLENIEIISNGLTFRKYGFEYTGDPYSYAQLQKVTEYSSQNAAFNPMIFAWTNQTDQYSQTALSLPAYNVSYVGDFNGDGRDDMVTVPNYYTYTSTDKWKLYLVDAYGNMIYTTEGNLNPSFESFLVNDFNGDGMADLMMQEKRPITNYPNQKYFYFYQSTGAGFIPNANYYSCPDKNNVDVLDYDGDGKLEFFYHGTSAWNLYSYGGSSINNGTIPSFGKLLGSDAPQSRFLDFNGDGCADLLTLFKYSYSIYEFKGPGNTLISTYSGSSIKSSDFLLFGDYNGDGATDIIKGGSYLPFWDIYSLTTGGLQVNGMSGPDMGTVGLTGNRFYSQDVDGDGKMDLVMVGQGFLSTNPSNRINVILSDGSCLCSATEYNSTINFSGEERLFNFCDFNGDGRREFLFNSTYPNLYSFASGTQNHLINTIIDGYGAKTTLTYLPMSNSNVYTRGSGASYPVSDFSSTMPLVSKVTNENGIGGTASLDYKYEGAKIHQQGKGFLCFSKVKTTNNTAGMMVETLTGYHPAYYYPKVLSTTKKTLAGASIESSTNEWREMELDAGNKRIYPYVYLSTQTNHLTGHSVVHTLSSMDSYGNPTRIVKNYGNGVTETTDNVYSNDGAAWLIGRLSTSTVTYDKPNESSVNQTIRYTYNWNGILKPDVIYYYENSPLAYTKDHDYDTKGNLTRISVNGATIGASQTNYSYTYDPNKGITSVTETDALGHNTTRTFDPIYGLTNETDYLNNTISYRYDAMDRTSVISNTNGGETTKTYIWTGSNKPSSGVYGIMQTANDGSLSIVWNDKLGRPVRTEKKGFGGQMILTDTEYNTKGQVYRVSEPYFAGGSVVWAETYAYDDYGRCTNINRNSGKNTTYGYIANKVTETTGQKSTWKEFDGQGLVTKVHDNGGDLVYSYFPDGKVKAITAPGGVITSMEYGDAARNQTKLVDPSAGTIAYSYDSFGRIVTQTNAKSQTVSYTYFPDGRINTMVNAEGTTTYGYNTNKQLTGISSPGSVSRSYGYDTKGRVTSVGETIAGSVFSTSFTFDNLGRLSIRTHPSGIAETMNYNSYGYLASVSSEGVTRYTVTGMNAREQLTGATYGSNLTAAYGFDAYGYPASNQAGSVQDYRYSFNAVTGNLDWRQNYKRGLSESFSYTGNGDNLDRLTDVTGPQSLNMTYDANGNIKTKSDISSTVNFGYGTNAGPYALTGVTSSTGVIPAVSQAISYTSFEKVATIAEGNYNATFVYNSDYQRAKMDVTQSGSSILTRWYAGGSYMKETAGGVNKEYTYIGGDAYSAPVVAVTQGGATTYYYLLRDYLGNITHQVNTANDVVAEYSFDAWGRRRNPNDWSYNLAGQPELFADRGFTSHEHLPWFNLVNMNGRLYDPVVGRFLSADPIIQDAGNTQNYNRYSYCLNNPLKFTDPSGYQIRKSEADAWAESMTDRYNDFMLNYGGGSGGGGSLTPHLDQARKTLDRQQAIRNEILMRGDKTEIWVTMGFYYHDENGKPILNANGNSGEFWIYEATEYKNIYIPNNNALLGPQERDWFDKTQIGMESIGLVNSSKEQLFKLAAETDASINSIKYVKGIKVIGKGLAIGGLAITGYQAINDIHNGNYYSAGTRALVLSIGLGATSIPFAGWALAGGIGLADAIWGDRFYGWVELNLRK